MLDAMQKLGLGLTRTMTLAEGQANATIDSRRAGKQSKSGRSIESALIDQSIAAIDLSFPVGNFAASRVTASLKTAVPPHYSCFAKRKYDPQEWAAQFPLDGPSAQCFLKDSKRDLWNSQPDFSPICRMTDR